VGGIDVVESRTEVQRLIGYLPENAPVYGEMLVQEYLLFMADMRQLDAAVRRRQMRRVVEECSIADVLTRPIAHLSKGYRQRVGLASALLHDPPYLILDEPTTGLDPNQIVEVRDLIHRMGKTKTVILSTHILPEVEASCGRAVILIDGLVRADGSLVELTRSLVQLAVLAPDDPDRARALLGGLPNVTSVSVEAGADRFRVFRLNLDRDLPMGESVAQLAMTEGWPLRELRRDDRSLEQVFRELTETAVEAAA
jgi:ABC-2 type transport system ATP-binding protein